MVPDPDCANLIGAAESELHRRFGPPAVRRREGEDTWLVYRRPDSSLRVRCAGPSPRVASWTVTFSTSHPSLASAAAAVGLWPAAAPDAVAAECEAPLVRRRLVAECGTEHSLTATVREGAIRGISVFDEAPEWE